MKDTVSKHLVTIGGVELDFNELGDSLIMQENLLPKDYDGDKATAVRLFLNQRNMLAAEFDRHFTYNYRKMLRSGATLVEDGESPLVGFSFKAELDLSIPTVAAIGKTKMSVGGGFSSEGKAKTHDINQGDLFEDNSSLDPTIMQREEEAQREKEEQEEREADEAKRKRDEEKAALGGTTPENVEPLPGAAQAPVDQPAPAKTAKKKVANKGKK